MTERRTWWKLAAAAASTMMLAACGTAAADTAADAGDEGGGGGDETVAVHGDWEISVYDADGTLDEHVEFSNALEASGEVTLASLLARQKTIGAWFVVLLDDPGANDICTNGCIVAESTYGGSATSSDLELSQPTPDTVLLAGTVEATAAGEIVGVASGHSQCDAATSAADCGTSGGAGGLGFTQTAIAPIPVEAGQLVQVDVTLSFTTG